MTPQIVVFNPSAFTAPVVSQSGGAWSLLLGPFNLSITVYLHVTSAESGGFTNLTALEPDLFLAGERGKVGPVMMFHRAMEH